MTDAVGGVEAALAVLAPLGAAVTREAPLGALTTYRVGGPAALAVRVGEPADLEVVATAAAAGGLPVLVVGRGSNLLVADSGFRGIAVMLDPEVFAEVEVDGLTVRAGAAAALPTVARQSVEAGLTGLEWAVGVPGSVGGGVRMNAGGHGSDMAHVVASARLFRLGSPAGRHHALLQVSDLDYGYRRSAVTATDVVLEASFSLAAGDPDAGRDALAEIVRWRREHQPGGRNAGSVFANPPGDTAGRLVDAAGLRGYRLGTAEVSAKHANFIQADQGGSADDVLELIHHVRRRVADTSGVELHTEVRLVGFAAGDRSADSAVSADKEDDQ